MVFITFTWGLWMAYLSHGLASKQFRKYLQKFIHKCMVYNNSQPRLYFGKSELSSSFHISKKIPGEQQFNIHCQHSAPTHSCSILVFSLHGYDQSKNYHRIPRHNIQLHLHFPSLPAKPFFRQKRITKTLQVKSR